jgi:hypothetical protein
MRSIRRYNNIVRKAAFILLVMLVISNIDYKEAFASSAAITFSSKTPQVKKGDTFSVLLTVKSSDTIGDFEAYVSYDPDIMKFETGGAFIDGGDGLLKISDINTIYTSTTKKYSMKFKALDVGTGDVGISDSAVVYNSADGNEMSVSSNRLSITVASSKKLSKNNSLQSLKISPGTITPGFSKDVWEYSTTVSGDTNQLFVSAIPADSNAVVTVDGDNHLKTGQNIVKINVKAPSGDSKDYTILVKKEEAVPSISPSPTAEAMNDLQVIQDNGNIYLQKTYKYQLLKLSDESLIPSGYYKTQLVLDGVTVDAYTNKANDLDGEFVLVYAKNENGDIGFYQYDRVEKTLQRYNPNKVSVNTQNAINTDGQANKNAAKVKQLSYVIAVLCAVCAFLMICVIRYYLKLRGFGEDDMEE